LQKRYNGPYVVIAFVDLGFTVILKSLTTGKTLKNKVHVNHLKTYNSPLNDEEKRHLRMENEEGLEMRPEGRKLITVDVTVQTDISFENLRQKKEGISSTVDAVPASLPPPLPPELENSVDITRALAPTIVRDTLSLPREKIKGVSKIPVVPGEYKEILDARMNSGNREYLVSRYRDRQTGTPYNPCWILDSACPLDLLLNYGRDKHPEKELRETRYNLRHKKTK